MSVELLESHKDEGYSSDEGPPELTWDEIQNSVYEFDPVFEFDAPQWYDFSDREAMYAYDRDTRATGGAEGSQEEDWFSVIHEGHESDDFELRRCYNEDFAEDIDIGLGGSYDTIARMEQLRITPKKSQLGSPKRVAMASNSPLTSPSSPQEPATPSHPRRKAITSALSPTSKFDSPLRSGALRVPIAQNTTLDNTSNAKKTTGPQRLLVPDSPTSPSSIKTKPSSPSSPSSLKQNISMNSGSSPKSMAARTKTNSKSPTREQTDPHVLPRYYVDTSKPAHVSQCPPRAVALHNASSRRPIGNLITKRQQQPSQSSISRTRTPSSALNTVKPTSQTSIQSKTKSPVAVSSMEAAKSPENTLLSKVDAMLNQAKQAKQIPAYEPRRFGIKEIKAWEQRSGNKWHTLSVEERQIANQDMDAWRRLNGAA